MAGRGAPVREAVERGGRNAVLRRRLLPALDLFGHGAGAAGLTDIEQSGMRGSPDGDRVDVEAHEALVEFDDLFSACQRAVALTKSSQGVDAQRERAHAQARSLAQHGLVTPLGQPHLGCCRVGASHELELGQGPGVGRLQP